MNGNVTLSDSMEGAIGMYSDGTITFVTGKWDMTTANVAIQAKDGIVIPSGFGVTLPQGGKVALVDGFYTVTEADGATVAAHAIIEEKSTVTVTFNAGEGAVDPASVEINAGEAIGELPVPTREGWVFMGWYLEPAPSLLEICQGTAVTAETVVNEDATVYAHWRLPAT